MTTEIKKTQVCDKCLASYQAIHYSLFGVSRDTSGGLCPACRTEVIAQERQEETARKQAEITLRRNQWRAESGIPPKFMPTTFTNFQMRGKTNLKAVKDACQEYAKNFPLFCFKKPYYSLLLISVEPGVGKTHLACAIAHAIYNRWQGENMSFVSNPIAFVSEPDLYRRIQATYNYSPAEQKYRESEQDIINNITARPLVILDDVGKEPRRDMDFIQRIMFAIVDKRYTAERPMVITSNKEPPQLIEYLGAYTFDRITEITKDHVYAIKATSYRRKEE